MKRLLIYNNKSGFTLIILIFAIMVFAILGWTLSSMQSGSFQANLAALESENALYAAEAAAQWALQEISQNLNWRTSPAFGYASGYAQHQLNSFGEYQLICRNPQAGETGKAVILATGFIPSLVNYRGVRTIKLIIDRPSPFQNGLFGLQAISMSGQCKTDSYNSTLGAYNQGGNKGQEGDVGTNGDIALSGQVYIGGDASTGPSGTFNKQSAVAGNITHDNNVSLPAITAPSELSSLPSSGSISLAGQSSQTLNPGNYKYSRINLSGQSKLTIIGPANIYLTNSSSIDVSGQAEIIISAFSAGPVNFYIDGSISLSGQGITNQTNLPKNLCIYGCGTLPQSIAISGQANLYAAVYAPSASIAISGQGDLYGAFVGNSISMSGQADMHYDEALKTLNTVPMELKIEDWQEQ